MSRKTMGEILEFLELPWEETVLHHEQFINLPGAKVLSHHHRKNRF